MNNQTPTAQSGPSDRAIAQAFREVTGPNGGTISNDHVVDFINQRASEIDATTTAQSGPSAFRKRPVVIEAVQLARSNGEQLAEWCGGQWLSLYGRGDRGEDISHVAIRTLEGTMRAELGDWIIKGVAGEFYPCKPEIFAASYEPAKQPPAGARDAVTDATTSLRGLASTIRKYGTCAPAALELVADRLEAAITGKADGGDILIDDVPLSELQFGKAYFATVDLPDDIRVPLDELWADAAYLVGRVQTDGSFGPTAVESIKRRIDAAKLSIKCALHAATQPAAPGAVEPLMYGKLNVNVPIAPHAANNVPTPSVRMETNTAATGTFTNADTSAQVIESAGEVTTENAATGMGELPELPEPEGWTFQHEDTGRMTTLENDGINNPENFQKNNHRLLLCDSLYSEKQMRDYAIAALAAQPAPVDGYEWLFKAAMDTAYTAMDYVQRNQEKFNAMAGDDKLAIVCREFLRAQAQPAPVVGGLNEEDAFMAWAIPEFHDPYAERFDHIGGKPANRLGLTWEYNDNAIQSAWAAWMERAMLAARPGGDDSGFYLASFREKGCRGAEVLWWAPNNAGYTTDLEQAGIYTELTPGYHDSEHTVPVPVSFIRGLRVRRAVDPGDSLNGMFRSAEKLRAAIAAHPAPAGGDAGGA